MSEINRLLIINGNERDTFFLSLIFDIALFSVNNCCSDVEGMESGMGEIL